jgi:hydrogenase nickel incorporation protein HypA/HybF
MHEVALAVDLIEQIEDIVREQNQNGEKVEVVESVYLELGEMSHVVEDSFEFAFEIVSEGKLFENTRLKFENVPVKIRCRDCGGEFEIETQIPLCPGCGSSETEILQGKDFILKSIELR